MEAQRTPLKIGIIGGGIAGISAAFALHEAHDVTLFEKNGYVGGHTNTIEVKEGGSTLPIDTGFIVCNRRNYPTFYRFLERLGIKLRDTEMSFGFSCERSEFGYIGPGITEFLRKPSNILNPSFVRLYFEQRRFNARAVADLSSGTVPTVTLRQYVDMLCCSEHFVQNYLIPISAAIWSTPERDILSMPAITFIQFFKNHGMLELSTRPQWQTVVGGSQSYVRAFISRFRGAVRKDSPIVGVSRSRECSVIKDSKGNEATFDKVILACHANEALALLTDPSPQEQEALGSWKYYENDAVLHSDPSVLPKDRRLWASWNYFRRARERSSTLLPVTYYMNRLQGLQSRNDYFVTLNSEIPIHPERIHYQTRYTHPAYTDDSVASQAKIRALQGAQHTYFCGSYMGYGFHEDAAQSGTEVAQMIGGVR